MQFTQYTRQFLAGDMKQRRIGKYAVECGCGQIEFEKILMQYLTAAVCSRHYGEPR